MTFRQLLVAALVALGAGCGGSDGAAGANGKDGSSCHVADNGDGTVTITCDDGSQATVSDGTDGADGQDGADGRNGKNGADGSDAEATRISESFYCTGSLENTGLGFSYDAVLFSSGDLFVAGSVNDALTSASDTKLFAPDQKGYETASVSFRFDEDGMADGGWFSLSLDRSTLVTVIEYRQSDPGPVADVWTMQPDLCVHNMY